MTQAINQFISYLAYSGIMLVCLHIVYRLFLSDKTFHRFNRLYLLLSYAVAFGFLPISRVAEDAMRAQASAGGAIKVVSSPSLFYALPQWGLCAIAALYVVGVAVMLAVTLFSLGKVLKIRRSAARTEGNVSYMADEAIAPFCWGGRIFLSEKDCTENGRAILAHENTHLAKRHWVDIMIAQAVIIANWFNPAAWLMLRELKNVHEYQADAAVAHSGVDAKEYQLMLIRKTAGLKFSVLANCLSHGSMRKRIDMMLRKPSARWAKLGSLMALPILAAVFMLVNYDAISRTLAWHDSMDDVSFIVNGNDVTYDEMMQIDPAQIKAITVTKDPETVILIELKDK